MALRRDDACTVCAAELPASTRAQWDSTVRRVTCLSCAVRPQPAATSVARRAPAATPAPSGFGSAPPKPAPTIDTGIGGRSAQREYERRKQKHEAHIEAKWGDGKLGSVAKFLTTEPQSTTSWAKGAEGERRLASHLGRELDGHAIVLNDRRVPGTKGNIDHLVIAPSGIWIVDAKNHKGRIERRDVGGWFKTDVRLFVAGRDRSTAVAGMQWQLEAVQRALIGTPHTDLDVHRALCFVNADISLFARPGAVDGVWIIWAKALVKKIREAPTLNEQTVTNLALHLSTAFSPVD